MLDDLLLEIQKKVQAGEHIPKDDWIDYAFRLNSLYLPAIEALERSRQNVAIKKLDVLKGQEKRNVALAEIEVQTTDDYRLLRIQEAKIEQTKEYIRIAKLNSNNLWPRKT